MCCLDCWIALIRAYVRACWGMWTFITRWNGEGKWHEQATMACEHHLQAENGLQMILPSREEFRQVLDQVVKLFA